MFPVLESKYRMTRGSALGAGPPITFALLVKIVNAAVTAAVPDRTGRLVRTVARWGGISSDKPVDATQVLAYLAVRDDVTVRADSALCLNAEA